MAYTVNKTNSSASPNLYTVNNSVVNTETDISFIGKGYAGYGETVAENFLHLLENFSNTSAPTKPIIGQLWWDSTNSRLKVHNGSAFVPAGSNAPYQSAAPSSMVAGDVWIDSDTDQLYLYTGSASVLVGPPTAGTTNGFTFHTILDSVDANQNITKWFNSGNLIAEVINGVLEFKAGKIALDAPLIYDQNNIKVPIEQEIARIARKNQMILGD